jgi:hypothetical protein
VWKTVENSEKKLTENSMLVLSWFTARSSEIMPVCFKTLTLSPVMEKQSSKLVEFLTEM